MSVVDDRGQRSETSVELVEVLGDSPPGEGDFYTYSTTVTVRNRDHRIVVAVHDPLRGNMLASTAQIEP